MAQQRNPRRRKPVETQCSNADAGSPGECQSPDPLLRLWGIGKDVFRSLGGEAFISSEREIVLRLQRSWRTPLAEANGAMKRSRVQQARLSDLEAEFDRLLAGCLLAGCLQECAQGRWGLFGQNDDFPNAR